MIEDLDGATTEPSRRMHVAVLSASVAAVSLVLLYVLLVPAPRMDAPPLAASPAPGPTNGTVVTLASGPAWLRSDQVSRPRDAVTTTLCVAVPGSNAPAQLTVFDSNGRPIAAYTSVPTGQPIAPRPDHWGEIRFTVTCDVSDVFAPRINRAR